jgi:hypothetical protein
MVEEDVWIGRIVSLLKLSIYIVWLFDSIDPMNDRQQVDVY